MRSKLGLLLAFGVLAACATFLPSSSRHVFTVVIEAQSLPMTKTLAWDAGVVDSTHPAADSYVVRLDGAIIGTVTTGTTQPFTITTLGPHTLTVDATNIWGSTAATLNINVRVPNAPANPRVQ